MSIILGALALFSALIGFAGVALAIASAEFRLAGLVFCALGFGSAAAVVGFFVLVVSFMG